MPKIFLRRRSTTYPSEGRRLDRLIASRDAQTSARPAEALCATIQPILSALNPLLTGSRRWITPSKSRSWLSCSAGHQHCCTNGLGTAAWEERSLGSAAQCVSILIGPLSGFEVSSRAATDQF